MSKRISSDSRRMKAAPHSTVQSQVVMMTSSDHPTGLIQHVACENLDDEGCKHHGQQVQPRRSRLVAGASVRPLWNRVFINRSLASALDLERMLGAGSGSLSRPSLVVVHRRQCYLIALIRSSAPFGQSLPYFST